VTTTVIITIFTLSSSTDQKKLALVIYLGDRLKSWHGQFEREVCNQAYALHRKG